MSWLPPLAIPVETSSDMVETQLSFGEVANIEAAANGASHVAVDFSLGKPAHGGMRPSGAGFGGYPRALAVKDGGERWCLIDRSFPRLVQKDTPKWGSFNSCQSSLPSLDQMVPCNTLSALQIRHHEIVSQFGIDSSTMRPPNRHVAPRNMSTTPRASNPPLSWRSITNPRSPAQATLMLRGSGSPLPSVETKIPLPCRITAPQPTRPPIKPPFVVF